MVDGQTEHPVWLVMPDKFVMFQKSICHFGHCCQICYDWEICRWHFKVELSAHMALFCARERVVTDGWKKKTAHVSAQGNLLTNYRRIKSFSSSLWLWNQARPQCPWKWSAIPTICKKLHRDNWQCPEPIAAILELLLPIYALSYGETELTYDPYRKYW